MTGRSDEAVQAAARWLLTENRTGQAVLPEMRRRFGLTSIEAVAAIRIANEQRMAAGGA